MLKINEEVLIAEFKKSCSGIKKNVDFAPQARVKAQEQLSVTEKVILKFLVTNEKAAAVIMKNITPQEFSCEPARQAANHVFKEYAKSGATVSGAQLLSEADAQIAQTLSLIIMDEDIPMDKEALRSAILKMRKNRLKSNKDALKEEIKQAEETNDSVRLKELIRRYNKINSEVRNA